MRLKFQSEKQLHATVSSLKPETKKPTTRRSRILVQKEGSFLTLKVEAQDTVALRASLNAYLRWVNSLLNIFEILDT